MSSSSFEAGSFKSSEKSNLQNRHAQEKLNQIRNRSFQFPGPFWFYDSIMKQLVRQLEVTVSSMQHCASSLPLSSGFLQAAPFTPHQHISMCRDPMAIEE